ncbi:MAG: hypothetical protein BWX71_00896 [Deltaproteobacteria bacterium ADurb.Bin072]|nr:MAG: hypothetical protein BWX71_00896 [Deltaproteobacteria bacterium ADurb.Bin072]
MEPVCDWAALDPAWERPAFRAITGFFLVTSRAVSMNLLPSAMPSRYMAMAFTSSRPPM